MNNLKSIIKIEELNLISIFLGNEITIKNKYLYINQSKYIERLLIKFNILNNIKFKSIKILKEPEIKLKKNNIDISSIDINKFQKEIGSLLYLILKTRLNIIYQTIYLSRFINNPNKPYFYILEKL